MTVWRTADGKYRSQFKFKGSQYGKKGFKTKAEGNAWEAEERKRLTVPPQVETPSISFLDLSTKYLEYCAHPRMQLNTVRAKAHYFRNFLAYLEADFPAEQISKASLLEFLRQVQREEGEKTANRHLRDLKALYNWGILNDVVQRNPARTIEPYPEIRAIKYVPPPEDIDKLLMAASQEDMDLLITIYHTGGRIGEILRLNWEDVNFEKKWIRLWTRKRRRGELQEDKLAMTDKLYDVLKRRWAARDKTSPWVFPDPSGNQFNYDSKRNLMRILCEQAQVKPFGFHAIRHHVASIIADSGKATLGQIQKFLRHRRATTTEIYLHEVSRDQYEVAAILDTRAKKSPLASPFYGAKGVGSDQ